MKKTVTDTTAAEKKSPVKSIVRPKDKPFQLQIFEVLAKANQFKQEAKQIDFLQQNNTFELRTILMAGLNPKITFSMPEGAPPYKQDVSRNPEESMSTMKNVMRLFPNLLASSKIPQHKKESVFVSMLEGVNVKNAEIIIAAKDKKLLELFPNLKAETIIRAIPEIMQ